MRKGRGDGTRGRKVETEARQDRSFEDLNGKPLGEAVGALRNVTGSRWARKLTATAKKESGLDNVFDAKVLAYF
jgi:hypothetical protein